MKNISTRNSQRKTGNAKREIKKSQRGISVPAKIGETPDPSRKPHPVQLLESATATRRKSQTELRNYIFSSPRI